MSVLSSLGMLILAYLIGSIPFGFLTVKLTTGKDVRGVESGRTGGTNAMRAAGFWVGLATAILDLLKSACSVWLTRALLPGDHVWLEVLAPVAAILGHNHSIFLPERTPEGKWRLRGGAGGAPCVGGSMGLWGPSVLIIVPLGAAILYFGGYASITTLSVAVLSTLLFALRAALGLSPWQYAVYGVIALVVLAWALRPNIQRLIQGNERIIGFRARKKK
jgi:glycerol-3-phosphate acyltransferase PlsY